MGLESIAKSSLVSPSKDTGRKKRTNRSAKLKQCKLDARREQWLSQVKDRGTKNINSVSSTSHPPSLPQEPNNDGDLCNLEVKSTEENDALGSHGSDSESLTNISVSSCNSGKDRPSTGSSTSSRCFSGTTSEEEEEEEEEEEQQQEQEDDDNDGGPDDWETIADAFTADESHNPPNSESPQAENDGKSSDSFSSDRGMPSQGSAKQNCSAILPRPAMSCKAWRPDDAGRPQSLPTLSKQFSFPMKTDRCCGHNADWVTKPLPCPICYEDLDKTDSSFLPCSCGFRLCLFCHKRILEADARCPGCRKQYNPVDGTANINPGVTFLLSRSVSMNPRT